MKVLVLFDVAYRAAAAETFSPQALKEEEDKPTEADVLDCLQRLGHEADTLAVYDDVACIVEKVKSFAPDVVFNLTESFHCNRAQEPNIPALLELMGVQIHRRAPRRPDALQG